MRRPLIAFGWKLDSFMVFLRLPSIIRSFFGYCWSSWSWRKSLLFVIDERRSVVVFLSMAMLFMR